MRGDDGTRGGAPSIEFGLQQEGAVRNLRYGLDVDFATLRAQRPPVLLLGGLTLLRPLGFAGIPTIVASPYPDEPALVSRYCGGRCRLPPLVHEEAAAQALLDAGDRLLAGL